VPNPGALNVEFDIYQYQGHIIGANSFIRVWGISVTDISQSAVFGGKPIVVQGGMGVGLPLANPSQSGILATGTAWQVFGNWVAAELTLDILLVPPTGDVTPTVQGLSPPIRNCVLNWPKNTQLSDAIKNALTTAYPSNTVDINVSQNLKQDSDEQHAASDWTDLSHYVNNASIRVLNNREYFGINITLQGSKFIVRDVGDGSASASTATKQILFQDLIGQPTWIKFNQIQFQTPMRADIDINDVVSLPPSQFTSTFAGFDSGSSTQTYSTYRNASAFGGTFRIWNVHHVGNHRAPDGRSWCTVFEAVLLKANTATGASYDVTDISTPAGTA